MVPLKYNVRNLRVRWKTTLMTMLGTGLVVWSSCVLFGLVDGLEHSLNISGEPLDLIVMRPGSTNETTGGFESAKADQLLALPGIARDESGHPLVAAELLNIPIADRENGTRTNVIVRGVQPASRQLRPDFRIIEGRDLTAGKGECIVSPQHVASFQGGPDRRPARIRRQGGLPGRRHLHRRRQLGRERGLGGLPGRRPEHRPRWLGLLRPAPRAPTAPTYDQLRNTIENDTRFKLAAIPETVYFQNQSRSSIFLKGAGTLIAVLLTFGAMFAAANTMFAAVSTRTREIGTMRRPRLLAIRHPRLLPGRVADPLQPGRTRRHPGRPPPQRLDLRDQRLQQLRLAHRRLPSGPPRPRRRDRDDPGHGRLRRDAPGPPPSGWMSSQRCENCRNRPLVLRKILAIFTMENSLHRNLSQFG